VCSSDLPYVKTKCYAQHLVFNGTDSVMWNDRREHPVNAAIGG
jgi:hypothetical protein